MCVLVERPKIPEQSDPSPECSVTYQAVPASPWLLGPCRLGSHKLQAGTGARGLIPAPPRLGLPAWTLSFTVFYAVMSFPGFLTFCYRMNSDGGGNGTGPCDSLPVTSRPPQPPQAPQWVELGSLTEAMVALSVGRQRRKESRRR